MNTKKIEDKLKQVIFPQLEEGRPNWDRPHTIAVVANLKEILSNTHNLNIDKTVLLIAAYAHDWGYCKLFKKGKPLQFNDVKKAKEKHMTIGAQNLQKLLNVDIFNDLTKKQKQRAVHLVKIHDDLAKIKDTDERVLVEGDTLGGLDIKYVTPAFSKESNDKWMKLVKQKRYPLFITNYGKEKFKTLYKARQNFYKKQ